MKRLGLLLCLSLLAACGTTQAQGPMPTAQPDAELRRCVAMIIEVMERELRHSHSSTATNNYAAVLREACAPFVDASLRR